MSNWPARKLPEINIGGTMFFMDTRMEEFREVENFSNRIPFITLPSTRKGFLLDFDKRTRNMWQAAPDKGYDDKHVVTVRLPPFSEMDPVGWKCMIDPECPAWGAIARSIRQGNTIHIKHLLHEHLSLLPKKKVNHRNGLKL